MPVEGMESWPISPNPKPAPPHHVKMPGRPRKERRRDSSEPRKPTKMSRVGTVIRCKLCRGTGHNTRSCPLNPNTARKANKAARRKKPVKGKVRTQQSTSSTVVGRSSKPNTRCQQTQIASTQQSTSSTVVQKAAPNKRQRLI